MWSCRTTGRTRRSRTSSGAAISTKPAGCCTPTNRPGCRRRCYSPGGSGELAEALFASLAPMDAVAALQQGTGRRAGGGDRRCPRHGDQSGGGRSLRARHHRVLEPAGLSGIAGHEPDPGEGARQRPEERGPRWPSCASLCPNRAPTSLRSNYFEENWQRAFWGANYPRLRAVKAKYDPDGLFFVHHGVGSEDWSPDGFTRTG